LQGRTSTDDREATYAHSGDNKAIAADFLVLQKELEVATTQLERWKSDHSWTLEQLAKGQEQEKARMEGQIR